MSLNEDDPERTLETLEFVKDTIHDPHALSTVASAIGDCGSSRSSSVLVQLLKASTNRDVLFTIVSGPWGPSNRDAIPALRERLLEEDTEDNLSDHAAEALLNIDPTDVEIVSACIDAEAASAVADALRHHDQAAFCLPTRIIGTRFRGLPLQQHVLKSVRNLSSISSWRAF